MDGVMLECPSLHSSHIDPGSFSGCSHIFPFPRQCSELLGISISCASGRSVICINFLSCSIPLHSTEPCQQRWLTRWLRSREAHCPASRASCCRRCHLYTVLCISPVSALTNGHTLPLDARTVCSLLRCVSFLCIFCIVGLVRVRCF